MSALFIYVVLTIAMAPYGAWDRVRSHGDATSLARSTCSTTRQQYRRGDDLFVGSRVIAGYGRCDLDTIMTLRGVVLYGFAFYRAGFSF